MSINQSLLKTSLDKCIGLPITKVVAGGSLGSILTFDIGEQVAVLFVYCTWRLAHLGKVLTGSHESTDPETGNIPYHMQSLSTQVVTKWELTDYFDLQINFSGGSVLTIFCDVTPNYPSADYDENWSICFPHDNLCIEVSKDFLLNQTPYSSS